MPLLRSKLHDAGKPVSRLGVNFSFSKSETEDSLDRILAMSVKLSRCPPEKGTVQAVFSSQETPAPDAVNNDRQLLNEPFVAVAN